MLDCMASIEISVVGRTADIGGFKVHRALPHAKQRMVGPFIFLDQMGPEVLARGFGLDVRPHPHIGLATVTYLFEGSMMHRDSLGVVQEITPGALNWMTAGRGVVHSERSPDDQRPAEANLFGIQAWFALPLHLEECDPFFEHHDRDALPHDADDGVGLRVILGELDRMRSPMAVPSETLYVDLDLARGARYAPQWSHTERAAFVVAGDVEVRPERSRFEAGTLVVFRPGAPIELVAGENGARVMLLGGEPMDGKRFVWWNFVSSSRERIEQAKDDWRAQRLGKIPGETELIPLPGEDPPPVNYP